MFERFTDRARQVVFLAQDEARMLNHNHMGTEHILLGLIHESEGVAAKALLSLGIALEGARQQVEQTVGRGRHALSGHIPFTPRAKKVLELSLREALQLGHNYIRTEHILLGLIREGGGVAAQVLVKLGVGLKNVHSQVLRLRLSHAQVSTGNKPMTRIFISYRREETSHIAGRVADWLTNHLDGFEVFMDVDSIDFGVDFRKVIAAEVGKCDVLVAVMGTGWSAAMNPAGQRRLEMRDDLVRIEVETALTRGVRVIPVLVEDANMPALEELPAELASLARRNASRIRHETFRPDVLRLISAIKKIYP
jgi:hypothetical protein